MSTKTLVREKPLEMVVSQKEVNVEECLGAVLDICNDNLGLKCVRKGNVLKFTRGSVVICSLGWTQYGVLVLSRLMCPDFIMVIRLCVVTMDELSTGKNNDMVLLEAIFGEKLFREEPDSEEVVPLDHEYVDSSLKMEDLDHTDNERTEDLEEDSDDIEWI